MSVNTSMTTTPDLQKQLVEMCMYFFPHIYNTYEGIGVVVNERESTYYIREYIVMEDESGKGECKHWLELCMNDLLKAVATSLSDRYRKFPESICSFQHEMLSAFYLSRRHPIAWLYDRYQTIKEKQRVEDFVC